MKVLIDSVNNKIFLDDKDITDAVKEISIKGENKKVAFVVLSIPTIDIDMKGGMVWKLKL